MLRIVEDDGQTISAAQIWCRIPGARMAQLSLSEVQLSVARLVRSGRLTDARNGWYGTAAAVRADNVSHAKAAPVGVQTSSVARQARPPLTIANAFTVGLACGKRYDGDPFRAARDWGLPIIYSSDLRVLARLVTFADGTARIQLSTGRLGEHARNSIAHELGHRYDMLAAGDGQAASATDDSLARLFAAGFLSAAA